jgi:hypothetical protein
VNRALWTFGWLAGRPGLSAPRLVVFEAELGNIALLFRVVFNGVVPVVALAETSGCSAESLTFRLCLVYVHLCVGVLDD